VSAIFRRRARLLHPDKCRAEGAREAFDRLNAAHRELSTAHGLARAAERWAAEADVAVRGAATMADGMRGQAARRAEAVAAVGDDVAGAVREQMERRRAKRKGAGEGGGSYSERRRRRLAEEGGGGGAPGGASGAGGPGAGIPAALAERLRQRGLDVG